MSVPTFQQITLPLLRFANDGKVHAIQESLPIVAEQLGVSDADANEMLPSGTQTRYYNRFTWAITYLRNAGLLTSPQRGRFQITDRGRQVLQENPQRIDLEYLKRFPEFREFRERGRAENMDGQTQEDSALETTPEEAIESGFQEYSQQLAVDLLDRVKACSPSFFERLVVELLVKMGYGGTRSDAGRATKRSNDGGIDGIIKEDRLGLDTVYIQAKRWEAAVGRPLVQAFAGSLEGVRARKGVMITTSRFSDDAQEYVDRIEKKIVLIDGKTLAGLMVEHGVGVSVVNTYQICRIDNDYFEDGV